MKRTSTADRADKNAAMFHSTDGKASTVKHENSATTDGDASSKSSCKKIKLSTRKESSKVEKLSQPKAEQHALISPESSSSSSLTHSVDAGQAAPSQAVGVRKLTASAPVLHGTGGKLPATAETASPAPAYMPAKERSSQPRPDLELTQTGNDSRRQEWLQRDQQSFIFDEITDPSLLALFDMVAPVSPTVQTAPQLSDREQARRLQPIAHAITRALEGVLADVMRKFMSATKRDAVPKTEFQEAYNAFAAMMQVFNRAKIAAVDGKEAGMLAELKTIRSTLDEFLRLRFHEGARYFGIEKQEKEALGKALNALLTQCGKWLDGDEEEIVSPWSPSLAPSSPETRQRAVSSPVKPSESWPQTEDGRASKLSLNLSGHIIPRPSQHRIGPPSPASAATASATSTPPGSPLTSPVASPVASPVVSPKESSKSFRLSALIGSTLSSRSRDAGRKEPAVKGHARKSLQIEPGSLAQMLPQQSDKPVTQDKAMPQKNNKTLY